MISIVIPLYNKERQIEETLLSVFAQVWSDYEIVIVDDGSTDRSVDIVKGLKDSRIRIVQQPNAGVSAARNRGIEEAHGELIAFLDADDEWKPNYLSTQMELVKKYPQCDVFATNYEFQYTNGKRTPTVIRRLPFQDQDGELTNYFEVASYSHPPLWTSAVMISRSALQSIGGFPVGIKSGEDLLTWARLSVRYHLAYCKTCCAVFNVEGLEVTSSPKRSNDEDDYVGRELYRLFVDFHPKYLCYYLSHWHKMRSSVYMRQSHRIRSIREAIQGLRFRPSNYKLYVYIFLNLLPSWLQPFSK